MNGVSTGGGDRGGASRCGHDLWGSVSGGRGGRGCAGSCGGASCAGDGARRAVSGGRPVGARHGTLAAALGAGWVGNLFMQDRSRLVLVVAVSEASAVVLFLVMLAPVFLPGLRLGLLSGPLVYTAAVSAVGVAISASVATVRLRRPRGRLGWDGAASLLASAAVLVLGISTGGAGLLPLVPERGLVTLGYERLAWISLVCLVAGASMAVLRSGRFSPGHALGRDAAATLALVAAIPLGVVGSISVGCSNLVGCSG
jgi:hypothetical protein